MNKQNEHDLSAGGAQDSQELTVFVQSLLEQMQSRFAQMSEAIIGRIDEMGSRIDDLEKSIGELMEQSSTEGKPAPKE
ncbi:hypothetical protein SPRG_02136 [Saprolegnia parasitica CBS 223.65]|uniref:Heat shock factor binding protein 1 n=1 Tax=Saprolegnia parasitica (strain CBS 223.65) TaxID=695850 RepID=A0A067CS54_SAPPC|nr:hypothetical protein SPRG_02136 [Saprolegnia parasitica CBS 223.65]KDO33328.1 hypothetical protein SPRG_02136 [Saprolegnia parasitica CBS 223.65]|eukprot:XP_012196077.1 hypothetical protein SPRG_02136 [Saprolegnia parasitica CBS 223.65]